MHLFPNKVTNIHRVKERQWILSVNIDRVFTHQTSLMKISNLFQISSSLLHFSQTLIHLNFWKLDNHLKWNYNDWYYYISSNWRDYDIKIWKTVCKQQLLKNSRELRKVKLAIVPATRKVMGESGNLKWDKKTIWTWLCPDIARVQEFARIFFVAIDK